MMITHNAVAQRILDLRVIKRGLAKKKTIKGEPHLAATPLAKQELYTLLQRNAELEYWYGVLAAYSLLSKEEWEQLDADLNGSLRGPLRSPL